MWLYEDMKSQYWGKFKTFGFVLKTERKYLSQLITSSLCKGDHVQTGSCLKTPTDCS